MKKLSIMMMMLLAALSLSAQTNIRYVSKNGSYGNTGQSWDEAMNNIQDAINSVAATGGYVFVAKGTYTPTESTESTGGSTLYMSFKIPSGVKVYGGFKGDETGATPDAIITARNQALTSTELGSFFRDADHETILSGNLSAACEFNWNSTKEIYDPTFYGNTYHVVWFALGTKTVGDKEYKGFDADGKAIPLSSEAVLDGFTITGGHAYNNSVTDKAHNAYGGGAYMVKNSTIRNCQFYNCDASRDGGAIYMNGGGTVDKCFIHNCQALGLGVLSGFGGGICMDGGDAQVLHTALVNNVARMGGGLATSYHPEISTKKLGLIVASCVMSSNVATTEGGGAYLDGAGLMTNCTVVRNKCNGSGVTSNGMVTGRAAGVYVRDHAHIYNSVLWGGKCASNNDIQYANSRSNINNASLKPELHYVALNEADHVDWSATTKNNVFKLSAYNDQTEATAAGVTEVPETEGFPMFDNPATSAGHGTETTDPNKWAWHTEALSYLNHKGILISDLTASCGDLPNISDHRSITGDAYITHCTLGAYTSTIPNIVPEDAGSNTYNIYVDPSRNSGTTGDIGGSWNSPVLYMGDALHKADELSKAGKKVNIYIKEGVANNTNSYTSDRARDISFTVPNNVHVYGGYPKGNEDTDRSGRNPVAHPTVLSANIHGNYDLNVAHLVSFIPGVTDATLDGVEIRYANARSDKMTDHNNTNSRDGAAIFLYDATGVKIKNVTIAHCTARNGAGVFAIHNSSVTLENCIIHNNEVTRESGYGIIYAENGSTVTMNHCDVIRNVGNAFVSENTTAQTINNSVFYANMRRSLADTNGQGDYASITPLTGSFTGSNNLFDEKTQLGTAGLPVSLAVATKTVDTKTYGTLSFSRSDEANYPRFANPTKNAGVSTGGDITYYGRAVSFEPTNLNPMVNAASTGDVAHTSPSSWGYDITGVVTRDFGGLPDIGAVENHASDANENNQPAYGTVMYVRDYNTYNNDGTVKTTDTNTTGRDGSSWSKAINGNGTYGGVNGLQYAVNQANQNLGLIRQDPVTVREYNGTTGTNVQHTKWNLPNGKENAQVWVGAGVYTNTAGFQIKNHVKVYGAFPKTGNPGMNERHPLLSSGIALSSTNKALALTGTGTTENEKIINYISSYESILQTHNSITERNNKRYPVSVLSHPTECRLTTSDESDTPASRTIYEDAEWDGFTVRYGYRLCAGGRNGGAGVQMYENVTLRNCIVRDNLLADGNGRVRGAGVYCDGSDVINCYIMDNEGAGTSNNCYGGGIYMIQGTMYNSVICGNSLTSGTRQGAGCYFESANFYNNTVVNNTGASTIGVYTASKSDAHLTLYNSIIMGQDDQYILTRASNDTPIGFNTCFIQTNRSAISSSTSTVAMSGNYLYTSTTGAIANPFALSLAEANANYDYRIKTKNDYNCVNVGTEDLGLDYDGVHYVVLPDNDMDYTERIQDCTVDIGAYEFNGAVNIEPTVVGDIASFYVTPNGAGTASAANPANAACAAKLQKVIDAAGRYKFDNPGKQVIVKVANSASLEAAHDPFKYYATRTTDTSDENVRVWSIIIPRGVEVWGGYSDGDNFAARNITANPTYFDSYYMNKAAHSVVHTYHVVTFTDKVFDENGKEIDGRLMSEHTSDRAIIDGIFITGGQADGEDFGSTDKVNINQYGGAAIVTDYAHVRNCILKNNTATYGGALALTHGAIVSGSLFLENEANNGGALYVFENATNLSDGTVIATKNTGAGSIDLNMPHVYTSTIVKNNATAQGGGVWFGNSDANVRFNSCVLWQNESPDQANVAGVVAPNGGDNTQTVQFYPFAYSAVQNQRMPGTNNILIATENKNGARFDIPDDPYYGLQKYSALLQNGMPTNEYITLKDSKKLAANDYAGIDRLVSTSNSRAYVEIGARSLDYLSTFNPKKLLLRLFVSDPYYVNMDAAQTMMDSGDDYYSQEGSSFAFPFQKLDHALDYIINARRELKGKANNLPFEIFVGKGEYHPYRDLAGNYGYSLANTFLVPEGVSIYGGFDPKSEGDHEFLGQYWLPKYDGEDITINTNPDPENGYFFVANNTNNVTAKVGGNLVNTYTFSQVGLETALAKRDHADINANNIIEPWEFKNQTVLSGAATNMSSEGVYHVITIVADETLVGTLPKASITHNASAAAADPTLLDYYQQPKGSYDYEEGQTVTLNGLMVTGGRAYGYTDGSLDEVGEFSYYHGGGVLVDGNRYCDWYNKHEGDLNSGTGIEILGNNGEYVVNTSKEPQYLHTGVSQAVGFRDIPLSIENCKFVDNIAGYGGAVNSNGTVDFFNCSLEQNKAISGEDTMTGIDANGDGIDDVVQYPGNGGAVYGTHQISMFNTLLANNEAYDQRMIDSPTSAENPGPQPRTFKTLRNQNPATEILGGCGGAFFGGQFSHFHIVNSDFVRNQACVYPAAFTMNPNQDFQKVMTANHPSLGVPLHAMLMTPMYNQFTNTVFWGNDIHPDMKAWDKNEVFKTNSRLICNYGSATRANAYQCRWNATDNGGAAYAHPQTLADLQDDSKFGETAWFCAYEQNTGIKQNNLKDYRDLDYSPIGYAKTQIQSYGVDYQNCNIVIASDNFDLDGPNFVSPSIEPGIKGYTESADWSPARLNKLTDQGSGKIQQTISIVGDTYQSTFDTYTDDSQVPEARKAYSKEGDGDFITSGAYTMTRYLENYPKYNENLMLGEERYMESATTTQKLWRISYDPNPTHNQTYIDIGVYEYPHTELHWTSEGDEVDILWVSPIEKPENGLPEGSAWTQPTSDLQRAIETLLSSRNGHRKEIRLMDGQYTPIYTIEDNLSFYFNTEYVNQSVMMPENWEQVPDNEKDMFSIKSFTIKGGYSRDQNNMYDVDQFPAIIRGQKRTDGTGTQWNHAFYIKDAVQRYGNEVSDANAQGAFALFSQGDDPVATTIPIEFYGVTFVNDQALSNTQGAALCYEDQKVVYTGSKFEAKTYEAEAPKTANLREITYYTDDTYTTPSTNNAPTEYVKYQDITDPQTPVVLKGNGSPAYTPAKLVLANCKFMASGTHYDGAHQNDKSSSAVFIGKGGGSALLYNDVMHSNYGNPIVSMCNTEIINNTIALNAGYVDLGGEITLDQDGEGAQGGIQLVKPHRSPAMSDIQSKIFNTVLWKNNVKSTDPSAPLYGDQFSLPGYVSDAASGSIFARNAYTYKTGQAEEDITQATDYVSNTGDLASQNFNIRLSNTNADLIYGPNFLDPENNNVEIRDFHLTPSLRLLNKGENDYYNVTLPAHDDTDAEHWNFNIYDYAWEALPATDAGSGQRKMFLNIDLGAYEYQNSLNRVVYVNPNITYSAGQDGMSWENALGGSKIQTAIDLAALYHLNNDTHEAYVLVKGNVYPTNKDNETGEVLTLRDGVNVIGSIDPEYATDIPSNIDLQGNINFSEAAITNGINAIKDGRKGLAAPNANRTIISGVVTNENTRFDNKSNTFSALDGFEIHGGNVTEPVINVNPIAAAGYKAVVGLKNLIVRDTKVTGTNTNVANVGNALLYEVLMRDNTPGDGGAVLKLTDGGYLVSGTIEGTTKETTGGNATQPTSTGDNARTFNSLVNYGSEDWITNTLSGYSYKMLNKNQNYQLTEGSKNIDACATSVPAAITTAGLQGFIDYTTDRDLLGNPRLLELNGEHTNTLDRGAFETWKVAQDVVETTTTSGTYNGWTGTHYYPHDGSVVYIMEGNSLNSGVDLHPGYMLLQNGANLYGGGHKVDANYLAVERNVSKTGALLSLPFEMNYATGAQYPSYAADEEANKGELTLTAVDHAKAQAYNGKMRSVPNYKLLDSESPCWSPIASDATANASEGVLFTYTPEGEEAKYLIRFTANSGDFETPIYTENGDSKVVTLTQYNSGGRTAVDNGNTDDNTDFTDMEDMGWNAIGLPYLVSNYNPAETEDFTGNDLYNMHIPHELWLYYDGTVSLDGNESKNGANFYPVNSWENTTSAWHLSPAASPSIWVGEGFFLQTATLEASEDLTFHRPVYSAPSPVKTERWYQTDGIESPANEGEHIVATRYYAPNGIQLAKPVKGVNIVVDIYSDGSTRTRKIQK